MKVIKWFDKNFEKYILLFFLIVITSVLFLQVIMRFFFSSPTFWSDRIAQLSLVISTFFSVSYCIRRGSNLKIDLLLNAVSKPFYKVLNLSVKLIMLAFFTLLAVGSWGAFNQYLERGTTDAALGIPLTYIYFLIFLALVLTVVRCIQSLVFEFFPEKNPEITANIVSPAKKTLDSNEKEILNSH
ncbi:MAG: TRAP transporter small permease [Defluviitaleaceae bacterium]|nr:TRAP transporter small permease [Defluviitaleaceae bacterium]